MVNAWREVEMKKRSMILICTFLMMSSLCASPHENTMKIDNEGIVLGFGVDTSILDAAWTKQIQARMNLNLRLSPEFGLRLPLTFCMNRGDTNVMLFDFGIFLDYHPWGEGPFIAVALVQLGMMAGRDRPEEPLHFLNEVVLGWTWHVYKGLYIEPALIIRDPSGGFEVEYEAIRELLPGVRPLRFSLTIGWDFLSIPYKV